MKPKILLVAPYSDKSQKRDYLIPVGLLSIAGVLRQNKYDVAVFNAGFKAKDKLGYTKKFLLDYKPDIIGLGFPTDAFESAVSIAKLVKESNKNTIIIVGGIHPTAMPNDTLKVSYFDYLVHGEGELTILELATAITTGQDIHYLQGISYKKDDKIITNTPRPEILNLDSLPFDNLDLLIDLEKYPKQALGQMHTSRGCIYNCAYCSSPIIWKRNVRFRSTNNLLAELEYLYKIHKVRDFNFADDNFTLEPDRMRAVCNCILEKGLKIRWRCCSRADIHKRFDSALLKLMKRSGCKNICIGFESGSQKLLDRADRGIKIDEVGILVKMVRGAGIKVHADFIIGLPGENGITLNQTLALMKHVWKNARATMSVAIFKPYPGTLAYQRNEFPDLKGLGDKFKEIFNYADACNIKSLSGNLQYLSGRFVESITSPKELSSAFKKTVKAWMRKND
jgi:radical SAM superfamily enzyme YgiQ (UPF0313 family)